MRQEDLVKLVDEMTVEEKVDQLLQLSADFYTKKSEEMTGPLTDLGLTEENIKQAGSTLGLSGAEEAIRIQKEYMKKHRLGIPTLMMADIIHGFRTIFPIPLGLGSSWSLEAAEKMARISALEASVSGLHVTFSPMVDLVRDPRWGRVMESTGEDAHLNSEFAKALVHGYQGEDLKSDTERLAACVKHFAAYGAPVGGRDYNTVDMSERQLRESYLPSYKAAIDAGAKLVMTSFNTVDGIPATGNEWLFRKILREQFGFDGVVISDWGAVKELIAHGVAGNEKKAAELAIKAGVDIEMMTTCYAHYLKELVEEEVVDEKLLNEAVLRILELKNDLGLFENPHRGADADREKEVILSQSHRNASREIAAKSIVLLENNGVLPLSANQKVAVVGPGADSQDILGAWSWQGKMDEAVSLLEGMQTKSANILSAEVPCDYFELSEDMISSALKAASHAEVVVLALGEQEWMSGEAASRSNISLPKEQIKLFKQLKDTGKPIIVTLYNGRPLDISELDGAAAILEAWFPGTEGGNALSDILYGDVNPSGRLSMSFPENVGQVPVYYNGDNTGRPYEENPDEKYVSKYLDVSNYARYPFGYGLSYSEVVYNNLQVDKETISENEAVTVTVEVENRGNYPVTETVQLYIRDLVGEVVRPVKELKDFKQVYLENGEKQVVTFIISEKQLRYTHRNMQFISDDGDFEVMVGPNSIELQSKCFKLKKIRG
ncbi:beta-glucosidase BglX [Niallia circulans]|uniref:beta-glucosidase BglX n=1 Tax=Niallia TaxID=2837506 RepID=UPI00077CAFBF|nr:beta-glucosidase BglX [Niallia circulans]MDR4316737.1 beta-glucosidase BglX [Niallia circulans]MED3840270.1 beta-glucosidase BglX [Niallia circulans]MED4241958.1 beta-glucosidase BglX [Niallia circulans]MED4249609.1 beta-glucosidase BglX [Niallia circulans]PAD88250.1 beta-glucosidase BglX [Niallia circulans]